MTQDYFDRLIKDYNEDYRRLLMQASLKNYEGLVSSFKRLKNLYYAIVEFQASKKYLFRVLPCPLSFRANDDLLQTMGFGKDEIGNIYGFLEFVKKTHGREFEQCLEGSPEPPKCLPENNQ